MKQASVPRVPPSAFPAQGRVEEPPQLKQPKLCQCFSVLEDGALAQSLQEQEIEQFYSTNLLKNQTVQSDVRLARRLQEEEEQRVNINTRLLKLEEEDCRYAQMIQEEFQRCAEETRRREREDEEIAKQLQEEEEMEMRKQRVVAGYHENSVSPLCQDMGVWEQVLQDARFAQTLQQQEEETVPCSGREQFRKSPSGSEVDFVAAQVAQDEEIAHYMQRRQRRVQKRAEEMEIQSREEASEGASTSTRRALEMLRERLDSDGLHSSTEEEEYPSQNPPTIPSCTTLRNQHIHNIAEELDPTFRARKHESLIPSPQTAGVCLAPRNAHSIFYDYLPEPSFIPPTKRQSEKTSRVKAKEKRENCKQQ
ncbi:hypothetical protein DNTS_009335 [Danionella cerebrum]|uniref:Coiled-coil domain-containing protein n=1 Tax=Danionella cerebrum TaxID=2873325 RepID=A0A553QCJ7_9TELE|nr:hypothetical protein DNTS_009335 [Danionella translucida]